MAIKSERALGEEGRMSRLGRGLSALLGDSDPDFVTSDTKRGPARTLPTEFLKPSPLQPRQRFDEEELESLTQSVREKGILQPIIVRPEPGRPNAYEIVAGERRWRAAQRAQLHEVPVVVKELSDGEVLEIALIENVQRTDLNAVEEAQGYLSLMEHFGHTQDALAKLIGKSRSHVANTLRLLSLPERVKDMLVDGRLSAGHARALVALDDAETLADRIVALQLSVRETEAFVRSPERTKTAKARSSAIEKDADTRALEESVSEALGMRVTVLHRGEAGGDLRVSYKSLEQLDDICRRLRRA